MAKRRKNQQNKAAANAQQQQQQNAAGNEGAQQASAPATSMVSASHQNRKSQSILTAQSPPSPLKMKPGPVYPRREQ